MNDIVTTIFAGSIGAPWMWAAFLILIFVLLAVDLGVFNRKAHTVTFREALISSCIWIGLALIFNFGIYLNFGFEPALEFLTGYIIEKSLSVDNIFVFLVIFSYFAVPKELQHRALFFGILGALLMRGFFILLGAGLIHTFEWITYLFGGILVLTSIKLFTQKEENIQPDKNFLFTLFKKTIPAVSQYHGAKFFIKQNGKLFATPLFLVLIAIEITDIIFAVDSIPAIFAITNDPFIVFTSNIFAILGLRALYFLLASAMNEMEYLRVGLSLVLAFVGIKMLLAGFVEIPTLLSLVIIASILGASVIASLIKRKMTRS